MNKKNNIMTKIIMFCLWVILICVMMIIMSGVLFLTVQIMRYFFEVMMNGVSFRG